MTRKTTLDPVSRKRARGRRADDEAGFALIVAWSRAEPERIGELVRVPTGDPAPACVFGRGGPQDGDPHPRVMLGRQRPTRALLSGGSEGEPFELTAPFADPFISRVQLKLVAETHGVRVENLGRRALRMGDREVRAELLSPGDSIEIKDQLLLFCARRPARLPALSHWAGDRLPPFGEPDEHGIVGESEAAWLLRERIAFFAPRGVHVLVLGESGTGKELVARAIHAQSTRAGRPLVARNAATLPPGLIDAELFGNVKNYPNPGMPERVGLIGEADKSTLFLDEIGELPPELQTHLLRVLDQGGEYQRLGDAARRKADVRLVAATNRPLEELRSDLAARLSLRIVVPGLNERREDIPLLVRHLMRRTAAREPTIGRRFGSPNGNIRVTPALMRDLLAHDYATHVREVDKLLWEALASSEGDSVDVVVPKGAQPGDEARVGVLPSEVTVEAIRASLERNGGVQERVWRELGLSNRYVLKRLMKRYGLRSGVADDDDVDDGSAA